MCEGVVVRGKYPAVDEMNVPSFDCFDLDQFAIGEALAPIGLQQQLVTGGHFQSPRFSHIESGRMLTEFQSLLRTALSAGIQAILGHTDNFNAFIAPKLTAGLMKSQY